MTPSAAEAAIIAWTRAKMAERAAKTIGNEMADLMRADEQLMRIGLELIKKEPGV